MKSLASRVLILTLLFAVAGCAGSGRVRYDSPEEAVTKGMTEYEAENYTKAIEYFQGAFDFGRTHQWAADAQLFLARSYRETEQYLLAANEYTRFTQIFRSDPRVPEAAYELAMTYYARSPSYQLDQTPTEQAIQQFQLFIARYPDHDLAADAASRITELREKLARKKFHSAGLYERRGLFEAAAIYFEEVFDQYYDTEMADDALLEAMRMYYRYAELSVRSAQMERLEKAVENYDRLRQIFPNSPHLKQAEALYLDIRSMMDRLEASAS
ncbi:MAG: outer membrane protein assembly factor BamD [Rhodothermales bacterium]|nr:outer membrane protein assembly factor BamD [Rhodothermales bacterium]